MGLFLYAAGAVASLIGGIILLVAAFKKSIGTGLLTLLVPFYIFYFAFAQYNSENKGKVIMLWLGGFGLMIISIFIYGAAMMGTFIPALQQQVAQISEEVRIEIEDSYPEDQEEDPDQWGREDQSRESEPAESKPQRKRAIRQTASSTSLNPDTIQLKNGDIVRGQIIGETEEMVDIKIGMASGHAVLHFDKNTEIEKIERASVEVIEAVSATAEVLQTDIQAVVVTSALEWREDLTGVAIPTTNAQGIIHGRAFTCEQATLDQGSILHLRQGQDFFADLELMIFLFLKKDETIENRTFDITKTTGFDSPHIHMKWKPEDQTTPETAIFMEDYAMRLEFGGQTDGKLPGKIYICLPDEEKSAVAGEFLAEVK
ncbi:hypothetical protein ACFL1I_07785 [Candidatus Omnitrophota bacterium]